MATKSKFLGFRQVGLEKDFRRAVNFDFDFDFDYNYDGYKTDQKMKAYMKYELISDERDCFTIYARGLNIDYSHISDYWQWTTGSNGNEAAEAVKLKWLGVEGSFDTFTLKHGVQYKVSFLLNMKPTGDMKEQTVNLKLTLPNNTNQKKPVKLPKPSTRWQELEVGQFEMTEELIGEMKFSMKREFDNWMHGLIINGVQIKALQSRPETFKAFPIEQELLSYSGRCPEQWFPCKWLP